MATTVASSKSNPAVADPTAPAYLNKEAMDHVWIHSVPWIELAERNGLHVFDRGEGSTIYDVDGNAFLDGIAGLWVVNAGHGRKEIAEAMGQQAARLAYVSSMNFTTVPAVQLADMIAERTPGDLNRVFFAAGGSEAVESAIKIAKQVQAMRGFARRYKIIARRGSYHGMTYGAMSLTALKNEHHFGPFMYGVSHVPHPNKYRSDFGVEGEQADIMAAKAVEQEIMFQGPDTVAAVIGEPISTAAGVHVPSKVYWQMLREICDKHGVLLIADEVINGFGRTGKMFAMEHYDVKPDLITVAKSLAGGFPLSGVIGKAAIMDAADPGGLGGTYAGNPLAVAAANAVLDVFEKEKLVDRANVIGEHIVSRLKKMQQRNDLLPMASVRAVGAMIAFDIVKERGGEAPDAEMTKRVTQRAADEGLILLSCGTSFNTIRILVPLTAQDEIINEGLDKLERALSA